MDTSTAPDIGVNSVRGRREFNCDAAASYLYSASDTLAGALVDGIKNSLEVSEVAQLAAKVAVRVGARKGVVPGILAATDLIADPTVEFPKPDGVMALAVCRPEAPVVIGYVGDVAAYAFDGAELERLTVDHTKGQRMREQGEPEELAAKADRIVTTSIGRATVGTIALVETNRRTVLLLSDGVHRKVHTGLMAPLVREWADEPMRCAEVLVKCALEAGSTDDLTAMVLTRRTVHETVDWGR